MAALSVSKIIVSIKRFAAEFDRSHLEKPRFLAEPPELSAKPRANERRHPAYSLPGCLLLGGTVRSSTAMASWSPVETSLSPITALFRLTKALMR
jgi:hypothetical protein